MFKPGQSGNPKGRPPGLKPRSSQYRAMLLSDSEALVRKVIELALEGDSTALRICIDRLLPALKPETPPVALDVPADADLVAIGNAVVNAMTSGDLSADVAGAMLAVLQQQARLIQSEELEARIAALEQQVSSK